MSCCWARGAANMRSPGSSRNRHCSAHSTPRPESSGYVFAPLGVAQARLRPGGRSAPQRLDYRNAAAPCNRLPQELRLIEAALPAPAPVQRHRRDGVELPVPRQGIGEQAAQRLRQPPHATVLEKMDQLAQRAFVRSVTIRFVETALPVAAEHAAALGIERKAVQKRRPAVETEELGAQRRRLAQASGAHRHHGEPAQGTFTDATLIGKKKGKKAVRDRTENRRKKTGKR